MPPQLIPVRPGTLILLQHKLKRGHINQIELKTVVKLPEPYKPYDNDHKSINVGILQHFTHLNANLSFSRASILHVGRKLLCGCVMKQTGQLYE